MLKNKSTWVNPIPTNMTLFCWNRVDLEKINLDFWSTQFQQSQPDSNKVNPIPTKSTLFQQRPPQCQSTQFQQMGQPDSNNWVNPIPHSRTVKSNECHRQNFFWVEGVVTPLWLEKFTHTHRNGNPTPLQDFWPGPPVIKFHWFSKSNFVIVFRLL